jgi:catechol 2,3-dioxygenase-like lactoylglutathione lyase family enzyme
MPAALNHTIVHSKDARAGATFLSEVMGLPAPYPFGHFQVVEAANGVSLDYATVGDDEEVRPMHYAFLVSEDEFDEIFGRVQQRGLTYWADPRGQQEGEINTHDGGRGVYFQDPDGHFLEIITRPYGSGPPS